MPLALYALALGGFGIGLTEFVIMGLLPDIAGDFAVTEQVAGSLVSGYALAVAVGALAVTAALGRVERKRALLALLVLFIVGNLLCAIADGYLIMLIGRIVAAGCHGAFFGIGAVVAGDLVAAERRGSAISLMVSGLALANIAGVPLGTFLGQTAGWRSTFWVITAIGVIAFLGIAILLPSMPAPTQQAGILGGFRIFRKLQVWLSMTITVLGFGGMFGALSYIAYTLTGVTAFSTESVPWLLVVLGVGLFCGNLLGGRLADRNLMLTLVVMLVSLTIVLGLFAVSATNAVATIVLLFLTGIFGFAGVAGYQLRIMHYGADVPALASSGNIAAFNVGNAIGASMSGAAIAAGWGFAAPLWVGSVMTAGGVGVLVIAASLRGGEWSRRPGEVPGA